MRAGRTRTSICRCARCDFGRRVSAATIACQSPSAGPIITRMSRCFQFRSHFLVLIVAGFARLSPLAAEEKQTSTGPLTQVRVLFRDLDYAGRTKRSDTSGPTGPHPSVAWPGRAPGDRLHRIRPAGTIASSARRCPCHRNPPRSSISLIVTQVDVTDELQRYR